MALVTSGGEYFVISVTGASAPCKHTFDHSVGGVFFFTIEPPFVLGRWNSPSERCEGRALQIQPLVGIERKAYAERALLPVGEEAATSRAFIFYSSICVFFTVLVLY